MSHQALSWLTAAAIDIGVKAVPEQPEDAEQQSLGSFIDWDTHFTAVGSVERAAGEPVGKEIRLTNHGAFAAQSKPFRGEAKTAQLRRVRRRFGLSWIAGVSQRSPSGLARFWAARSASSSARRRRSSALALKVSG